MTITLLVIVVGCLVASAFVGALVSVTLSRWWKRTRERIAAPYLAEQAERHQERESLMRECIQSCVQAITAAQRETVSGVAREGFSALTNLNHRLLDDLQASRPASITNDGPFTMPSMAGTYVVRDSGRNGHKLPSSKPRLRSLAQRLLFPWRR
ncbi:MAG: hypothetical protein FLDDKLPJ_01179 [Phycisphaerae bacterium]|nr:hypothetical protein [Phycisphaerae bacterium]